MKSKKSVPTEFVVSEKGITNALDEQVGGDHYKKYEIQPIEFMHYNKIPPIESAIIKYATRHKDKGGLEDLKKIIHYTRLLAKFEYSTEL